MQAKNPLQEAKAFRARNSVRLALRAVPLALVTVAAVHATTNFNSPTTTSIGTCSGGQTTGSLTGAAANSLHGLSLSGNATWSSPVVGVGNCLNLFWSGTGSGTMDAATLPLLFDYTITTPANVANQIWALNVTLTPAGGAGVLSQFTCGNAPEGPAQHPLFFKQHVFGVSNYTGLPCTGVISARNLTVAAAQGQTLASYTVQLQIVGYWTTTSATQVTVNVPPASSININAPLAPTPPSSVPALSTLALGITAICLIALGVAFGGRRNSAGGMPAA